MSTSTDVILAEIIFNMRLKSILICFIAISFTLNANAQTKDSVDVIPHWIKNEAHSLKIKSTTTELIYGKTFNYLSAFDAKYIVKEVSVEGYTLEWTYTNSKLAPAEPQIEHQILAKLIGTKILIQLSDIGRFVGILNYEEVKAAADKALDTLILSSKKPTVIAQFKLAKQLISTKQGLEISLLKHLKLHNLSFGFNYKLNFIQTNYIKLSNPLGGQPFDAVEKVQLTKLDRIDSVCTIETSKVVDAKNIKISMLENLKKQQNLSKQGIAQISNATVEMIESSSQQLNFSTGLVQKSIYKRTIKLGVENRVSLLEINTID